MILPAIIGIVLLSNPAKYLPEETQMVDIARAFGLRNLALSITLLVAILTQSKRAVAFLLVARGLSDVGDPIASFIATKQIGASTIAPLVGAILTFLCAYYFFKRDTKPDKRRGSVPGPSCG